MIFNKKPEMKEPIRIEKKFDFSKSSYQKLGLRFEKLQREIADLKTGSRGTSVQGSTVPAKPKTGSIPNPYFRCSLCSYKAGKSISVKIHNRRCRHKPKVNRKPFHCQTFLKFRFFQSRGGT